MLLRVRVWAVAGLSALGATAVSAALAGSAGWRPPETIAAGDGALLSSPLVALDGRGTAILTWGAFSEAAWRGASAERRSGAGWTRSRPLPEVPQALAVNEQGDAAIAWVERIAGGDRVAVSFRRRGAGWSPPTRVSAAGQQASSPRVALDARGGALVVWLARRAAPGETAVVAAARSHRGSWSRTKVLAAGNDVEVATAADGTALVVWSQACADVAAAAACEPLGAVTRAATRSARGRWSRPRTLSDPGEDARHPRVRVNAPGTAVVLWETFDTNDEAPPSRGLRAAIGVAGGAFGRPQRLFDAAADGSARVALAPTGDAVAVWSSSDRIFTAIRRPRGRFGPPVLLGAGFEPEVGIDRRGAAVAVWTRPDGMEPFLHELFVRAARRPAGGVFDGGADLAPAGRDCTRHRGCASELAVAVAPSGGAVAVWLSHAGSGLAPGDRSLETAVYAAGSRR